MVFAPTAQAGAVATLCRVLRGAAEAEASVVEPGVKALQEICELPELQDAAMEVVKLGLSMGVWVNTYRYIFNGMNIHLPAILGFTRYQGFDS